MRIQVDVCGIELRLEKKQEISYFLLALDSEAVDNIIR